MCIHSIGSSRPQPQIQFPTQETASRRPSPALESPRPQIALAQEWARDSFTAAAVASRPRIDLG